MFGGILGYIFGGLFIGVLARLIKPGADPIGWILTIVLGITSTIMQWVIAIAAAIILLFLYAAMQKKKA